MAESIKINDAVTVGPQPSQDQFEDLKAQGFQSVINFRTANEDEQPLSPDEEAAVAQSLGMTYKHIPVSMEAMSPNLVDEFRQSYSGLPKPVFAHCASGKRAGAMVMMHLASEQGMSGESTLNQAEEMGFECDQQELRQFVKSYVDEHSS